MPATRKRRLPGKLNAVVVGLGIVVASCMTVRPEPTVSSGPPSAFQTSLIIPAAPEPVEVAAISTTIHASGGSCVVTRLAVGTTFAADDTDVPLETVETSQISEDQSSSTEKIASDDEQGDETIDEAFLERLLTGPSLEPVVEQIAEDESVIVPPSAEELAALESDDETVVENENEVGLAKEEEKEDESMESVRSRLATALARLQRLTASDDDDEAIPEEPESQDVTPAEALAAFACISPRMRETYAASGHRLASTYSQWHLRNGPPFRAVRLDRRYVSVYVNDHAFDDSPYMLERRVPIGAAVALPSFVVDEAGVIQIGPLLLLEKMPRGFDSPRGNWRYSQIGSDGQIVGITNGKGGNFLRFCEECDALSADAA